MLNLTFPALLFGLLAASFYGAAFHLWKGGGLVRLVVYQGLSWTGFWLGHFLAVYMDWLFIPLGTLYFGTASLGSLMFLSVGHWLSQANMD